MRAPTGVSLPSLYDANNRQQQLGPRGVESFFVNKQGLKIATYFWPSEVPDNTKAVLLAVHGHGAHIQNEYLRRQGPGKPKVYQGSWVQAFNEAGYSVCGIDQQGLGFSEGARSLRCYVEAFDDYVRDVIQLRRSLDSCKIDGYAHKPVFLLGASLGGCISVKAIHRYGDLFRGAMLLAPMLSLERLSNKGINKYLKPIAHLISWLIPTWPVVEVNRNTMYPDIQAEWDQDPLVFHGKTRARNASEYMKVTEWIVANMSKFNFPVISFCSENDTMCDPDGSRMLIDRSQSKDATLRNVNHMWHVLVAEDGNEKICAELIQWMNQRYS
ncbi:hypothetical protein WJX79_003355 [Trebouxia sp. C0005]